MFGGSVLGLSSLRQHESKSQEPSEQSKQLQAYLAKYKGEKAADPGKVKKKKKKPPATQPAGVRIYEENNTGFRSHTAEEAAEDEGTPFFVCHVRPLCTILKSRMNAPRLTSLCLYATTLSPVAFCCRSPCCGKS